MRLAKLGIVPALLASLAAAGLASVPSPAAAAAAAPQVYLSGQWGLVERSFNRCFQLSKEALKSQGFRLVFAQVYPFPGGQPQSVAVGARGPKNGPHTQASVKCVAGGPEGQSFFATDVASSVRGVTGDLAVKITDVLFGEEAAAARAAGRISKY